MPDSTQHPAVPPTTLSFVREDRLLFISDLHLEEARPDITDAFFQLLERVGMQVGGPAHSQDTGQPYRALFILGDFFEVWIGDDYENPFTRSIAEALKRLSDKGVQLYFMAGNRDFLLGSRFCKAAGLRSLADPTLMTVGLKQYALMHGDSLCTRDTQYMQFRHTVRNPDWQQQFLAKPVEERLAIARAIRNESTQQQALKQEGQHDEYAISDVSLDAVIKQLTHLRVNTLIHGHTHRPKVHTHSGVLGPGGSPCTRIVLGDWDQQGWSLEIINGQETLSALPHSTGPL